MPTSRSPTSVGVNRTTEPVVEVHYNPAGPNADLPVEALTGTELADRMPAEHTASLQRLGFHLLIVCSEGEGTHDIDFTRHRIRAGSVLHVRPGQAQKFCDADTVTTELLLWPDALQPEAERWFPSGKTPTSFEADPAELASISRFIAEMRREQLVFDQTKRRADLLKALLQVVLAKVDTLQGAPADPSPFPPLYRQLRELLEDRVLDRPSAASLASELGYSVRTLDRAAHAATSLTAKQVIDERIGLELRRQLADQSRPMSSIRIAFGFVDASAFAKFARRHVGEPPTVFRARFT